MVTLSTDLMENRTDTLEPPAQASKGSALRCSKEAVGRVSVLKNPHDVTLRVDPKDEGCQGIGHVDGRIHAMAQDEAVGAAVVSVTADDLAGVIHPGGFGPRRPGPVEGGVRGGPQREARGVATRTHVDPPPRPGVLVPAGDGLHGARHVNRGDHATLPDEAMAFAARIPVASYDLA